MELENKINKVIETALKNLNGMIDANTVVGTPIRYENGDYVIPISNVTFGYISGGGEYGKVTIFKKGEDLPFSAGNGAIVSVKPCGFLIKDSSDKYSVLSVNSEPIGKFIDKASDFLTKLQEKSNEN